MSSTTTYANGYVGKKTKEKEQKTSGEMIFALHTTKVILKVGMMRITFLNVLALDLRLLTATVKV